MGTNSSVDQMRESFAEQFEAVDENRYLYRRNQKGEPVPVNADERDRFIRQYVKRIWFILVGMMVLLAAYWGLVIWWMVSLDKDFPDVAMYVGTAVIAVGALVPMYWIRGAPARELQDRSPVGRERSTDEMRAMFFKKISYGQLAIAAGFGAILPLMVTFGRHPIDIFHGWGRLWLALGGALVLFAAIQALRKWRFEIDHPNDLIG